MGCPVLFGCPYDSRKFLTHSLTPANFYLGWFKLSVWCQGKPMVRLHCIVRSSQSPVTPYTIHHTLYTAHHAPYTTHHTLTLHSTEEHYTALLCSALYGSAATALQWARTGTEPTLHWYRVSTALVQSQHCTCCTLASGFSPCTAHSRPTHRVHSSL